MHELLPLGNYPAGETRSAALDIPDGARGYELYLARCTVENPDVWPDAAMLLGVQVELFIRGEWLPWGHFTAYGGQHLSRDGNIAATSWLRGPMRDLAPGRRLRVTLQAPAPVRTGITIEVN